MARVNIIRLKADWQPTLEWANKTYQTHGMTVTKIGRIGLQIDISFEGGDMDDFSAAQLSAVNMLSDLKANGEVFSSSTDVTSVGEPLPVYTAGDDKEASDD